MYSCFGAFKWKENEKVDTICFEVGIQKKRKKKKEIFSVSLQNKYQYLDSITLFWKELKLISGNLFISV